MSLDEKIASLERGLALVQNATEETYPTIAANVLAEAGPNFMKGLALLGYDASLPQPALIGCLTNCLMISYNIRWAVGSSLLKNTATLLL